jgi:hypothetical protein
MSTDSPGFYTKGWLKPDSVGSEHVPWTEMPNIPDSIEGIDKYTLPILLQLYPYYIHSQLFPYEHRLTILKKYFGKVVFDEASGTDVFDKKVPRLQLSDTQTSGVGVFGFPPPFSHELTNLAAILDGRFLMKKMMEDIISGDFNTDDIYPFVSHMETNLACGIWNCLHPPQSTTANDTAVAQEKLQPNQSLDDDVDDEDVEVGDTAAKAAAAAAAKSSTPGSGGARKRGRPASEEQ